MKITKKYRDPSRTKMYTVGDIPESLRYCRVRHNVKMKMQESVINGVTQSEALGSSSVFFKSDCFVLISTHERLCYCPPIYSLGQGK